MCGYLRLMYLLLVVARAHENGLATSPMVGEERCGARLE